MDTSQRVRVAIETKYTKLKDFSDKSGVNYRTLQHYLSGQRSISTDFLVTLGELTGVSASWVLTGEGRMILEKDQNAPISDANFIPIKRFDVAASAGHGAQIDSETGTGSYAFNQKWLDRRGLTANSLSVISVRGDSMEPDLYQDDLVLLDHSQTDLKDSHIYVMRFSDGLYVKRIQHLPEGQVHLISRNSAYPPITIKNPETAGVTIIGRVVASMHEW